MCYNTIVPKGQGSNRNPVDKGGTDIPQRLPWEQKIKKLKKVLDKPHKMWYNTNVKRTGTSYRINKMGGEPTASAKRTERTYYD